MKRTLVSALIGCVLTSSVILPAQANNATIATVGKPLRSEAQVIKIAERFIQKRTTKFAQWRDVEIAKVTPLLDNRNQLKGYEVQIIDDKYQNAGYLIVEAQDFGVGIAEYAVAGKSPTQDLIEEFETRSGKNLSQSNKVRFLWNGPGTAGMTWQNDYEERQFKSLNPGQTLKGYQIDRTVKAKGQVEDAFALEQNASQAVAEHQIDWSFKPFYQEYRTWQNSSNSNFTCYAGCTPIAAAMLIDFYDRNGYPKLIGDEYQQEHYTSSALMRSTIDQLRGALGTYCRTDGQGGTAQSGSAKLVDYMNTRGEGHWSARRISYAALSTFFYMKREIDAQRPAIVHYHTRGAIGSNHSAIAYGYEYGGFWSDNFLTVRTGWGREPEIRYNIESMGTLSTTIVSRK